jgi:uncharacterized phiE125 gp8 family phage protein
MAEPLTTAEAKSQLRVTSDHEDDLIDSYVVAAREWCEDYTGHILVQREVTDAFPAWGDYLTLRHQPITVDDPTPALTVSYLDTEGDEIEYASRVIRDQRYPWTIYPPNGDTFPELGVNGTITVTYTAGYASAADVPEKFRQAIRVLISSMHESRGAISEETERTARFLLRSYRGAVLA